MSKKKQKQVTPFFRLRFEISDTLEALSHELLVTMQVIDTALNLDLVKDPAREMLSERLAALKAVCSESDQ